MTTIRNIYASTFCNKGHDLATGKPIGHECYVIPPAALQAERSDDFDLAREIIAEAKRKGKWCLHRGIRVAGSARL